MEYWLYTDHQMVLPEYLQAWTQHQMLPERGVYLHFDDDGLALAKVGEKGRVRVDFVHGAAHHRRTQGGGELIAKAVNHRTQPVVWDATGGLGRDAFVLASLGLTVRVFEANDAVFALLSDGWHRAMASDVASVAAKMTLVHGNAVERLMAQSLEWGQPDVVYLDPMYPERQKSAAIKKEMAYFHELVGLSDADAERALFQAARQVAKKRVVVKRPRLGACLCGEPAAYQYIGKSTRFDVYLPLANAEKLPEM